MESNNEFTDKEIQKEMHNIERYNKKVRKEELKSEKRKRRNHIREIRSQNRYFSEKLHKFTTTKLLMYLIFLNCLMIELYTMWVMFILNDLSALYSLVGAVIGESLAFAVYCYKSFKETKEEQRLQFEKDQFFSENNTNEDDFEIINGDDDHSGDIPEGVVMEEDHS